MIDKNFKIILSAVAFTLFSITIIGLFWLMGADHPVGLTLAYAAGLSMIFLPCTLPLLFIIIPMCSGKGYKKGLIMAVLFGLGIALTLTIYGVIVAWVGNYFGLDNFSKGMFFVAGIIAYVFGLHQLRLVNFNFPNLPLPKFIRNQGEYSKAFFMGLLLGNAGVGCPNPAFYVLLAYITTTGSIVSGASLGFIHGLGRATPLIFLAILSILGLNATSWVASKRVAVDKIMGWGLIFVGVFIFALGIFGMTFWESSFIHQGWNEVAKQISPRLAETVEAAKFFNITVKPTEIEKYWPSAPLFMILIFSILPFIWVRCKNKIRE